MPIQANPMELLQMIKGGQNPQQLVMNILNQNASRNPMYSNLLNLAQNNRTNEIENIVRNIAKDRGIDYDQAFGNFRQMLGLVNK